MTRILILLFSSLYFIPLASIAAQYEVGPGKAYASIGAVPWEGLGAGDEVLIYWRSAPYREKWVVAVRGSEQSPLTIRGVPNSSGQLPVIDGNGATTRSQLNFWNEERAVLKIGGANTPAVEVPTWIVVENLDIRSGRPPYGFTGRNGASSYSSNSASIYIETGENIQIKNCIIHDSGNGIFVASSSRNINLEANYIYDNGIEGSAYEHNTYTEALGLTYQYNQFGPLRTGCNGNNLKDRSAGLVVRYNWIESGNRQLDLVDAEGSDVLVNHPSYRQTLVYGNILIEPEGAGNSQIVHYGGDSGNEAQYRKGTLYFFNNTVVSTRSGNTTLFRLSSSAETCEAQNNIFYTTANGAHLAVSNEAGSINLHSNYLKTGWVNSHGSLTGTVTDLGGNKTADDPGFASLNTQDFQLNANSLCLDSGASSLVATLNRQYFKHRLSAPRPTDNRIDIGAFERDQATIRTLSPPTRLRKNQ